MSTPEPWLGRDVAQRFRRPGSARHATARPMIGRLAAATGGFVAAVGRPVEVRRALGPSWVARVSSRDAASMAPPPWWAGARRASGDAVDPGTAPTTPDLPRRGLPRAARAVPDQKTWTPGGIVAGLVTEVARVRRLPETKAAGSFPEHAIVPMIAGRSRAAASAVTPDTGPVGPSARPPIARTVASRTPAARQTSAPPRPPASTRTTPTSATASQRAPRPERGASARSDAAGSTRSDGTAHGVQQSGAQQVGSQHGGSQHGGSQHGGSQHGSGDLGTIRRTPAEPGPGTPAPAQASRDSTVSTTSSASAVSTVSAASAAGAASTVQRSAVVESSAPHGSPASPGASTAPGAGSAGSSASQGTPLAQPVHTDGLTASAGSAASAAPAWRAAAPSTRFLQARRSARPGPVWGGLAAGAAAGGALPGSLTSLTGAASALAVRRTLDTAGRHLDAGTGRLRRTIATHRGLAPARTGRGLWVRPTHAAAAAASGSPIAAGRAVEQTRDVSAASAAGTARADTGSGRGPSSPDRVAGASPQPAAVTGPAPVRRTPVDAAGQESRAGSSGDRTIARSTGFSSPADPDAPLSGAAPPGTTTPTTAGSQAGTGTAAHPTRPWVSAIADPGAVMPSHGARSGMSVLSRSALPATHRAPAAGPVGPVGAASAPDRVPSVGRARAMSPWSALAGGVLAGTASATALADPTAGPGRGPSIVSRSPLGASASASGRAGRTRSVPTVGSMAVGRSVLARGDSTAGAGSGAPAGSASVTGWRPADRPAGVRSGAVHRAHLAGSGQAGTHRIGTDTNGGARDRAHPSGGPSSMPDLLVVRRAALHAGTAVAPVGTFADRLVGHDVRPAQVIAGSPVAPPRGGGAPSARSDNAPAAPSGSSTDPFALAAMLSRTMAPPSGTAGRPGSTGSSSDLVRSFLSSHEGPGASVMPQDHADHGSPAGTLRRFLTDSTSTGSNDSGDQLLSAPPPPLASSVDLDELTDRVVRRIERRVIDELERRGRTGSRGVF